MSAPAILHSHPLVEEILTSHRDHANGDDAGYDGYRGHVYRVLNLARALTPDTPDRDDKLAVAAAFHDLDAFSSLDYLAPSIRRRSRSRGTRASTADYSAWRPSAATKRSMRCSSPAGMSLCASTSSVIGPRARAQLRVLSPKPEAIHTSGSEPA